MTAAIPFMISLYAHTGLRERREREKVIGVMGESEGKVHGECMDMFSFILRYGFLSELTANYRLYGILPW